MTAADVLADLRREVGAALVTDAAVLQAYSRDKTQFVDVGEPLALVRARSREDIVATMRWASTHRVPVVPQGARTSLAGGATAVDGCILLNLERMNAVVAVDPLQRTAVVQPGVITDALRAATAEHLLTYPPDPASSASCTIGGNIATNAGGLCCVKYGVTRDFVRALEVVLADGSVLNTGTATIKGVAGYDLTSLFVGSEGTLGIVTEATLALVPTRGPERRAVALFDSVLAACDAVATYLGHGGRPSMLELMDGPTLRVVQQLKNIGISDETDALLIAGCDDPQHAPAELELFAAAAAEHSGEVTIAEDEAESEMFVEARRLVGPAHERLGSELVDDVCLPIAALGEFLREVRQIGTRHDLLVTCAGHAGDGNMHPSVVFAADDPDQAHRAQLAFEDIMDLGLRLRGTITGEHGVGRLKTRALARELSATSAAVHQAIKAVLDPLGILNPGAGLPN